MARQERLSVGELSENSNETTRTTLPSLSDSNGDDHDDIVQKQRETIICSDYNNSQTGRKWIVSRSANEKPYQRCSYYLPEDPDQVSSSLEALSSSKSRCTCGSEAAITQFNKYRRRNRHLSESELLLKGDRMDECAVRGSTNYELYHKSSNNVQVIEQVQTDGPNRFPPSQPPVGISRGPIDISNDFSHNNLRPSNQVYTPLIRHRLSSELYTPEDNTSTGQVNPSGSEYERVYNRPLTAQELYSKNDTKLPVWMLVIITIVLNAIVSCVVTVAINEIVYKTRPESQTKPPNEISQICLENEHLEIIKIDKTISFAAMDHKLCCVNCTNDVFKGLLNKINVLSWEIKELRKKQEHRRDFSNSSEVSSWERTIVLLKKPKENTREIQLTSALQNQNIRVVEWKSNPSSLVLGNVRLDDHGTALRFETSGYYYVSSSVAFKHSSSESGHKLRIVDREGQPDDIEAVTAQAWINVTDNSTVYKSTTQVIHEFKAGDKLYVSVDHTEQIYENDTKILIFFLANC